MSKPVKKQFEADFRDLPHAFLTTTKKGKQVYRIKLNTDEILANLENGKSYMCIDIPAQPNGDIRMRKSTKGKTWQSFPFYGFALEERKEATDAVPSV